jgi:hypothetical protein
MRQTLRAAALPEAKGGRARQQSVLTMSVQSLYYADYRNLGEFHNARVDPS